MKNRILVQALMASALAATLAAPALVSAQEQFVVQRQRPKSTVAPPGWKAPKLPTGAPDLQGAWTNASLTPLSRAAEFKELVLTEEQAAKLEGSNDEYLASRNQNTDPNLTIADLPVDCGRGFSGTSCGYDNAWTDPGETVMRVKGQPRSSFLTTPNGKVPPRKQGTSAPARAGLPQGVRQNDNPEGRSLGERCLMSFGNSAGPVMLPLLYNNTYKFVQAKDSVAILVEMVHDVRVVRLNAKHRTDGVRPWMGDSIGWYDGNTLVVETTNFPRQQSFQGSWENLKVTEKFTRVAPERMLYQFTVEDPTLWDTAWGGEYEFAASQGDVYEYACHEGNYGLPNILAGARQEERDAATAQGRSAGTQ
jgi:hypothetical protein